MENVNANVYTEVYEILGHMPICYIEKIPKDLLRLFETKRNEQYKFCVDLNKTLNEQNMLNETRAILSNLYRDFWASPETKKRMIQKEKVEREEYQRKLREKYNPDDLFKNRESRIEIDKKEVAMVDVEVVPFYKQILNKIKKFFSGHK